MTDFNCGNLRHIVNLDVFSCGSKMISHRFGCKCTYYNCYSIFMTGHVYHKYLYNASVPVFVDQKLWLRSVGKCNKNLVLWNYDHVDIILKHTHVSSNLTKGLIVFMLSVMNHCQRSWHENRLFWPIYKCFCTLLSLYFHLLQQGEEMASGTSILEGWEV